MKEIKKEVVNYEYTYEAEDGTVFNTRKECEDYESSDVFKANQEYKKLVVEETNAEDLWCGTNNNNDHYVDCVFLKTKADADVVKRAWESRYGYPTGDNTLDKINDMYRERQFALIDMAIETHDILVINKGCCCDDEFWIAGCMMDMAQAILDKIASIKARCGEDK